MPFPQSAIRPSLPHIHMSGLQCPVCDQPIPSEMADQVRERMETRERAASEAVSARLKEQFAHERTQIEANARVTLDQLRQDNAAAIEALKSEAAQREATARKQASEETQAAAQQQIDALLKTNANMQSATAEKIEALNQAHASGLAAANEKGAEAERIKAELQAAAREQIVAAEKAKQAAELEAKTLKANHETVLNERLQEQREALVKDKDAAILVEQAKTFDERQKLQGTVQQLQRQREGACRSDRRRRRTGIERGAEKGIPG